MARSALLTGVVVTAVACTGEPLSTGPDIPESPPVAADISTASANDYTVIDLGTLGGTFSIAHDINAHGQIVGIAETASGERHAFLWTDAVMMDLGTLGGTLSGAFAINDKGQIAGYSTLANGNQHAFVWEAGTMLDLGALDALSLALGINELGQVVGFGSEHAFLWDNGVMYPLDTPPDQRTMGLDINENGVIAGAVLQANQRSIAMWVNGDLHNLGTLGGGFGEARGINNHDQLVGWSQVASGFEHAFLWEAGTLHDMGTLGGDRSGAEDLNDRGQIAGWSQLSSGAFWAVLWDSGSPTILPSLGDGASDGAAAITESGQLVGVSELLSGERHAVLWRPLTPVDLLDQLIAMVQQLIKEGEINHGQGNALINKLNIATAMLNDGKTGPAINKIDSFINQMEGFMCCNEDPVIPPEKGQPIVDAAHDVIAQLGG